MIYLSLQEKYIFLFVCLCLVVSFSLSLSLSLCSLLSVDINLIGIVVESLMHRITNISVRKIKQNDREKQTFFFGVSLLKGSRVKHMRRILFLF